MGCVEGCLIPLDAYKCFMKFFEGGEPHDPAKVSLRVRTAEGEWLKPIGIHIMDFTEGLREELMEFLRVDVIGLHSEVYERLFPHHLKAYEEQFAEE